MKEVINPTVPTPERGPAIWALINTAQLRQIHQQLVTLTEEVSQLVDEATFDQQLSDLNAAIDELIAAVNDHVASHPDLTDESAAVVSATDKVKAAADAITGTAANGQPDQPPADTPPADAPPEATQLPS